MKKKRLIAGLAAVAAAAMIGSTWAAWTQTLVAKNEYETAKYSTFLEETFEGPQQWQPGITQQKDVWVKNDSTIPVIGKITIRQSWVRREAVKATLSQISGQPSAASQVIAEAGEKLPLTFDSESGDKEYAAILNFNSDLDWKKSAVVVLADSRTEEEGLRLGIPAVSSLDDARGKWLLASEAPTADGFYVFYYIGEIPANGGTTPLLLNSATMNPELKATISGSHTYYEKDDTAEGGYRKITYNTVNGKGYDGCTYTMDITMTTVQATDAGVLDIFQNDPIGEYIAGYITGDGGYTADSDNKLYFEKAGNQMVYQPVGTSVKGDDTGNWFMSFTNMIPGATYKDSLKIENGCRRDYDLYMKIIPREGQTELQEELLDKIYMKVYYDTGSSRSLLYDGTANGIWTNADNGKNMRGLVYLGEYDRGRTGAIDVELTLDPDIRLQTDQQGNDTYKYSNVLTKVDWMFMVREVKDDHNDPPGGPTKTDLPDGEKPGDPSVSLVPLIPRTGDQLPIIPLAVASGVMLLLMAVFGVLGFGKKKKVE